MQPEKQIISILGGQKTIGRKVNDSIDIDKLIRDGIPYKASNNLQNTLNLTDSEFAEALGISKRTLSRLRKSSSRLSIISSDRLYRITRIFAFAIEVIEGEKEAIAWLHKAQLGLGGRIPLELLNTDAGAREVEDLLGRIEHGVLS